MTMDFRSRSADVRREAADILWRFRSSRAARRAGTVPDGAGDPANTVPRPGLPVSPATEELIRAARQRPLYDPPRSAPEHDEAATPAGEPDAAADRCDAVARPEPEPIPAGDAAGHIDGAQGSPSADVEGATAALPPDAPASRTQGRTAVLPDTADDGSVWSEEGEETPEAPTHAADSTPDPMHLSEDGSPVLQPPLVVQGHAKDLMDLPGVGAGLVWLLGRCGVHTLADLARADAARLEQDLGLVGQLLDLPSWIDLARQTIDTERNPAP